MTLCLHFPGHPLDQLSGQEILAASAAVRAFFKAKGDSLQPRFNNITLQVCIEHIDLQT